MKTVMDLLREDIEEAIDMRMEALASGHAKDYADYRHLVGVITGLTSANERLKDLLKHTEDN